MANVLVPLYFFLFLGAVTLVPIWLGSRVRRARIELAREALARGQTLDPALLQSLAPERDHQSSARRNLGPGVLLSLLAVGLAISQAFAPREAEASGGMIMAALIVGSIGVGFLILAAFDHAASRKSRVP